jgi:predicted alternative tryptophan synthase beta-subunit
VSLLLLLLQVWQVRASYDAKPYRKTIMQTWCVIGISTIT